MSFDGGSSFPSMYPSGYLGLNVKPTWIKIYLDSFLKSSKSSEPRDTVFSCCVVSPLCSGLSLPPDAFLHASCRLGFITCNLIKATPVLKAFWLARTESKCLGFGSEMFYWWCCLQALWTSSPSSTACLESIRPPSADATLLLRPPQKPFLHDGSVGTASRTHFPLLPAAHTFPSQWLSSFLERVLIGHGANQIIIQQRH